MNEVGLIKRKPAEPKDADFALYIDFKRNEGNPFRVFRAADQAIRALQKLDSALCVSVDSKIQSILVLEEIEAGSLKIWLRNILTATDDQALKDLDWKPAVGKYLVRAKYAYIDWANDVGSGASLSELGRDIKKIAEETDVKHLPDYTSPPIQDLVTVTQELDLAKKELIDGDRMQFIPSIDYEPIDFNLKAYWDIDELEKMSIKETTKHEDMTMNLIVKKPDYLGYSKWDFRHGKKAITASISDESWLVDFKSRKFDIRPGDALRCTVSVEYYYGYDSELIKESYDITKIESILIDRSWSQQSLIGDDSSE